MTPDPIPTLRAMADADPTATFFATVPVEFDEPVRCGELNDHQRDVCARLFKKWSETT